VESIKKSNLSRQVFEQFKDQIITGKWKPGSKIPSENELSQILDVSRITVREALQKLVALEILEKRRGEGTFVKKYLGNSHLNAFIPYLILDGPEIKHVLEYRKIVEIGTVGLVAERANEQDIERLEETLENMKQYKDDVEKFAPEDLRFHLILAEITKNPVILKANFIIKDILGSAMLEIVRTMGTHNGIYYHGKIIEAIKEKDKEKAQQIMEEHLVDTVKHLVK
jgi:GntR family transcriptional regulator, transcriptional repressor for pyruvate dehydrogenase complex